MENSRTGESKYHSLAKEVLQECEQKFRILLDAVEEGVVIHDKFKIIDVNSSYATMLNCKYEEIIGRDVLEFAEPRYRDLMMEKILQEDRDSFQISALRIDGSTFAAELCSRIIPCRNNRLNLTVCRSLSRPLASNPASDPPSEYRQLGAYFDFTPEAYYLADATGKFIDVNQAAAKLFGYPKEKIIGKSFFKLNLLPTDQIRKAAKHLAFNIFGKPTEPQAYQIHRKDGRQIPVELYTVPVRMNDQTLMLGIVRNITDKINSENALRRAIGEIEILVEERRVLEQGGNRIKPKIDV